MWCSVMIYVHLKHLCAYEWKGSDRHEQTDLHSPRIRTFLMTLVTRISGFFSVEPVSLNFLTHLRTRETLGASFKLRKL